MSASEQTWIILTALASVLGPVDPWRAALWFVSTIVLAALLVYGWQRLVPAFRQGD
jgi:VIT1/CCC1 family predicted Fe2+/Mn2+ transporter